MQENNTGCYQILFELKENLSVTVGAVGHFVMPQGYYVFTGKANRGLNTVLQRHLQKKKKIRQHLDYISITEQFEALSVYTYPELFNPCILHQMLMNETGGHELIPGFGSNSDDHCFSHLFFTIKNPDKIIKKIKFSFKQIRWNGKNARTS